MLATAVVSGDQSTFNSSSLLPFEFKNKDGKINNTGSFDLRVLSKISNGSSGENAATLAVKKAISLDSEIPSITFRDTASTNIIKYTTFTAGAVIDNVTASWKNRKDGTYAPVDNSFSKTTGMIDLKERDYITKYNLVVGDTLYYKFTTTSGALTDEVETSVAIISQPIGAIQNGTLSNDPLVSSFNLKKNQASPDDDKSAEIKFISPNGIEKTATAEIEFVKFLAPTGESNGEYFEKNDILLIKNDFESGVKDPLGSFTDLSKGDMYIYRTERPILDKVEVIYGLILISEIIAINNGENVSINFLYSENTILE